MGVLIRRYDRKIAIYWLMTQTTCTRFKNKLFSSSAKMVSIFLTSVLLFFATFNARASISINAMAPLLVGQPQAPESSESAPAWENFRHQLRVLKQKGVQAISTDIWWGLIEARAPGQFEWAYYKKMSSVIRSEGLRWVPILSFHQLGGNVGDVGYMPVPSWVWSRFRNQPQDFKSEADLMFKSEQGNTSKEYISFWATDLVKEDYKRVMTSFRDQFAGDADIVDEINISLGPSGELRYPSYNAHDQNVNYPSRGALQSYSDPAINSFRNAMIAKYKNVESLDKAWGFGLTSFADVFPPKPELLQGPFWQNKEQFSSYGKDFFDWYNQSLVDHGQKVLRWADSVFSANGSSFAKTALGGKVPGVHWRMSSDRLAELTAGLIRTSYADWFSPQASYGYLDTMKVFSKIPSKNLNMKLVMHFTAIEMDDNRDGPMAASLAKSLVGWIGDSAYRLGIELKGENALAGELSNQGAWSNMFDAISQHHYSGVTLLRSNEIVGNPSREQFLSVLKGQTQGFGRLRCSGILW